MGGGGRHLFGNLALLIRFHHKQLEFWDWWGGGGGETSVWKPCSSHALSSWTLWTTCSSEMGREILFGGGVGGGVWRGVLGHPPRSSALFTSTLHRHLEEDAVLKHRTLFWGGGGGNGQGIQLDPALL